MTFALLMKKWYKLRDPNSGGKRLKAVYILLLPILFILQLFCKPVNYNTSRVVYVLSLSLQNQAANSGVAN